MSGGVGGGGSEGPCKDRGAEVTGAGQDNRSSSGGGNTSPRPPLDGAFLLQLLRKPPQARPSPPVAPLPNELHQPRRDPVGPSFPFPPHKVIAPPPAAVAADYSPPSPVKADSSAEPGIIRPVANHRRLPEDAGRPERERLPASRKTGYLPTGGYSGSGRRGSGFQKAMAGGGGDGFGGWTRSRRNGDPGYPQSGRRGKVYMARPHGSIQRSQSHDEKGKVEMARPHGSIQRSQSHDEKGKVEMARPHGSIQRSQSHDEKGKVEMVEQRRPRAVAQRRKMKEEWVPVNGRQGGKNTSKTVDDSKKEGNESSNSGVQNDDQIKLLTSSLTAGKNGLSEEESAFDDSACEGLEEGYSSEERVAEDDVVDDSPVEEHVQANESMNSVVVMDDPAHRAGAKKSKTSRFKELRSDLRGQHVSSLRMRIHQRHRECRDDIETLSPGFLFVYESLIPSEAEKAKQNKLLQSLQKSVNKEWPNAQLHLYGSCANTFGLSNSDIDICLAIDDGNMTRNEMLLKLAEILELDNLQNVQALTSARVPIVKMMDPETGISCDICINNLLAMVNTKLLKDYAQIDDRLRQLAFIVKHWARSRAINETYRGTLSSYAYVLMCIHFLQLRKPAILPCLQEMESTYSLTVDDTECAYFDQVEKLKNFGAQNKESIARLIWAFFHYWAYHHDYINDVVSVRTGSVISKQSKDWTKRIGNDRHLICIEDPFETSHDLGRVVDKHSIKILREEFERAADILQYNPDPSVTLFEPYIPHPTQN